MGKYITTAWIIYDAAISVRMARMIGPFSLTECGIWFVVGLALAIAAFVAEHFDRDTDRKQIAALDKSLTEQKGIQQGGFAALGHLSGTILERLGDRAEKAGDPALREEVTQLKIELDKVKAGMPRGVRGSGYTYLAPDLTTTINIQDPKGGQVPHRKTVKGFVQPPTSSVQVFVQAGPQNDRWWYRQGDVRVVAGEWTARCVIGNDDSETGGEYRLCTIAGAKRLDDKFKTFPPDVVRSEIVTIFLNRNLSDDWMK